MDLTVADPIAVAVTAAANDSDSETPPTPSQTGRFIGIPAYTNGGLKRHYPKKEPPTPRRTAGVTYKECMRNHAAAIGGHALDGCCEFMPSPAPDSDSASLKCAACGCHRNFHRRDPDDPAPLHRHLPAPFFLASAPPAIRETPGSWNSKKRHRTKFSEEQKGRMREFSERFGWKVQKIEKGVIENFCREIGVGREVLKVWMHNHKNTNSNTNNGGCGGGGGGGGGGVQNNHQLEGVHDDHLASSGDGSSSSG